MPLPPPLSASGPPTSVRPGWWQRHWKWAVPLLILFSVLLFAGAIFGFVALLADKMRDNDVYRIALAQTRSDADTVAALGTPIEADWFFTGQTTSGGDGGHAYFEIPVEGPRGRARIFAHAHSQLGVWKFGTLAVTVEGSTTPIDLMPGLSPDRRLSAEEIEGIGHDGPIDSGFDDD